MTAIAGLLTGLAVIAFLAKPRAATRLRVSAERVTSGSKRAWLLGAALLGVVVTVIEPLAGPIIGVVVLAVAGWRRRWRTRCAQSCRRAIPDFLYAFAAELRAGRPVAPALESSAACAGPLERDLTHAAANVLRGGDTADEFVSLARRDGCERLAAVAAAWRATSALGASVSGLLERLAEAYEHDDAADDELAAALAGPRSTVVLLMCLPAVGIALGASVGAHPLQLLVHRPLGWALASGATVLEVAGAAWWRRIVVAALAV